MAALPLLGVLFLMPRLLQWWQVGTAFIAWPWQFDLAEGVNLNATVQLAQGHNIYAHNGPDTFLSAPYTPLFFLLNLPATWIAGPSFGFGRAVSMLATVAVAALLFYLVRKLTGVWSAGLLAGALWLSLSPVIVWSALYTQHILALALGLSGLAWTLRYSGKQDMTARQTSWSLYGGAVLFALAFYAKQSTLDAAAATCLWLLLVNFRVGLRFLLALITLLVAPFVAVNIATQGGLWEKIVANHALPLSDKRAWRIIDRLWGEYWPLVVWGVATLGGILAGFFVAARQQKGKEGLASPWTLVVLYSLLAAASVLARIGSDGINYNHLLDLLLPLCLLAGLSSGWIIESLQSWQANTEQAAKPRVASNSLTLAGITVAALLTGAQILQFTDPHTWYTGMWPEPSRDAQMRSLSKLVADTPGDILSDDSYLLLNNGRKPLFDDLFMVATLSELKRWDDSVLVQSLKDRRFVLLMLFDTDRWPEAQQHAREDNYTRKFPDVLTTYVPNLVPSSPQYGLNCTLVNSKDVIELDGYSLPPGAAWDGVSKDSVLRTTLYWKSIGAPKQDYASFVHLINDKGESLAAQDNPQTGANIPTSQWQSGSIISDTASLPIPANLTPGRYRLVAGMYSVEQATGAIQPLRSACTDGEIYGDAVLLGSVEIK